MIEATNATVGTSLKNQSLWSSKTTQILSEKNCEARKTIENIQNFYSLYDIFDSLVDIDNISMPSDSSALMKGKYLHFKIEHDFKTPSLEETHSYKDERMCEPLLNECNEI